MPSNSRSNRVQQLNQRERFPNHDPRRQPPPFRGRGRGRGIAMGVGRRQPHHDPHEEAISESDDSRMEEGIYDARDKDVKGLFKIVYVPIAYTTGEECKPCIFMAK
ncbi:uncharacterized protein LOC141623741 isoform X5 [Silene latifolia]|uniref:uncharacterized protein LOC141623741 isoform X5 n=1 Tax=Silene latifolia TaxID=37657 RepID=UPI003D76A8E8